MTHPPALLLRPCTPFVMCKQQCNVMCKRQCNCADKLSASHSASHHGVATLRDCLENSEAGIEPRLITCLSLCIQQESCQTKCAGASKISIKFAIKRVWDEGPGAAKSQDCGRTQLSIAARYTAGKTAAPKPLFEGDRVAFGLFKASHQSCLTGWLQCLTV